jgi:serine/threonine protein phosphatase PrpC
LKLTAFGVSHPGRVRSNNEDALLWDLPAGLFIVADGMGGHQAGEVASRMAVETVRNFLEASRHDRDLTWPFGFDPTLSLNGNRLVTAVRLANRKIYQAGEQQPDLAGMGTTVVVALIENGTLTFCGVGDSRLYVLAGGALAQLTHDDSWVATVLAREPGFDEQQLAQHPMRHVLTNVVGARDDTEVEVGERALASGDMLLLCSDGLYGGLDDASLQLLMATPGKLEEITERLVQTSLERNGSDNITAVTIKAQ